MKEAIVKQVRSHDWALQVHAFYAETEKKSLRFDVVLSFDITPEEAIAILHEEVHALYPDYEIMIIPDVDTAD